MGESNGIRKFIKDNKLVSGLIAFLFSSVITYNVLWGTWVTNQLFCHKEEISSHIVAQNKEEKATSQQIKEVKEELSNFKKEAKEDSLAVRKDIVDNQKELLKLLIEIKRDKK
jgi:hypothetical protein